MSKRVLFTGACRNVDHHIGHPRFELMRQDDWTPRITAEFVIDEAS